VLLIYNSHHEVVNFKLPTVTGGRAWDSLVDTNQPDIPPASFALGTVCAVTGRSLFAFGLSAVPSQRSALLQSWRHRARKWNLDCQQENKKETGLQGHSQDAF
jgi:hypothetical protein